MFNYILDYLIYIYMIQTIEIGIIVGYVATF